MQEEAAQDRTDGPDDGNGGSGGEGDNQEDLNNEQFEEEEEFIEEDRGHPQSLLSELYKDNPGSGVGGSRQLRCTFTYTEILLIVFRIYDWRRFTLTLLTPRRHLEGIHSIYFKSNF